jgi:hypothetical protein
MKAAIPCDLFLILTITVNKEGFCGTIFCKCATLCRVAFRIGVHQKLEGGCRKGGVGGRGRKRARKYLFPITPLSSLTEHTRTCL